MRIFLSFLIALLGLSTTGCSRMNASGWEDASVSSASMALANESEGEKRVPVIVEVLDANVDTDDNLSVRVSLLSRTTLEMENLSVSLIGLRNQSHMRHTGQNLSELFSDKQFLEGDRREVLLAMSAAGLDEYQVKFSWGSEAIRPATPTGVEMIEPQVELEEVEQEEKPSEALMVEIPKPVEPELVAAEATARARITPPPPAVEVEPDPEPVVLSGKLSIDDVQLERIPTMCKRPPCDYVYIVRAVIENGLKQKIDAPQLAVALKWVNEGEEATIVSTNTEPPGSEEELIELSSLSLNSGASKAIRIKVDREIPPVPGGAFYPQLRILHSSAE